MKAIVYHDRGDIRYDPNFPDPQIIRSDDVKIKVHYCGICGTDLKEYSDGPIFFPPKGELNEISQMESIQVMGHEISGEVIAIGDDVTNVKVGDKVVVEVTGTCLDRHRYQDPKNGDSPKPNCPSCVSGNYNACDYLALIGCGFANGGCAEYLVVASSKVIAFDQDKIPMDIAALIQPIAVSWHAVKVSNFKPGSNALILGGGPIGLTTIFALKGNQVSQIVLSEPALARRQLAEKLGVITFDPTGKSIEQCVEDLKKLSPGGYGYEYSYDCSGVKATFETGLKTLKIRGCATNVAIWAHKSIPLYPMEITLSEKMLTGSICFVKKDFEESIKAIENGLISIDELKMLITSKIHLQDGIEKGFLELINHKEKHIKILFSPKSEYLLSNGVNDSNK
ncbi:(R,R)-butanediol dehydrogenase/diacetyl reductase [Candida albicans P75063]|nr:(R,R)-butanediol dehydrogenase/diacetyl reductase [Candida albicans P75063]